MYNRTQLKLEAKAAMHQKMGLSMGLFIVYSLIVGGINVVPGIGSVASIVLSGVLSVGFAICFLEIVRNWEITFSDLFKGFDNFGPNCLAGVLIGLYTLLWSLLLIIPGIIKAFSYSMTYYILADHPEYSATEAINESKRMMNGHKMDLFVLMLSFIGWYLVVCLTFGIAIIYVGPYIAAANAKFYEAIKNEPAL